MRRQSVGFVDRRVQVRHVLGRWFQFKKSHGSDSGYALVNLNPCLNINEHSKRPLGQASAAAASTARAGLGEHNGVESCVWLLAVSSQGPVQILILCWPRRCTLERNTMPEDGLGSCNRHRRGPTRYSAGLRPYVIFAIYDIGC